MLEMEQTQSLHSSRNLRQQITAAYSHSSSGQQQEHQQQQTVAAAMEAADIECGGEGRFGLSLESILRQ